MMDHSMAAKKTSGLGETLRTVIYAVIIALGVRTFLYEPFNIPSGSMIPTLLVGDFLFVSKFTYGYSRFSLPWSPPLIEGRILARDPERGDVAVFKLPSDNSTDYIKRVIGLPGDRIQVREGILHINRKPVQRELQDVIEVEGYSGRIEQVSEYVEILPNGRRHLVWEASDHERFDNTPEFFVPPGHFFMMGDNRDSSQDSRAHSIVGFVPLENLVGRAEFLFFSHNNSARLWEIWRWPEAIRASRIGDGIQ
jgi:signal peptidase I